MQIARYHVMTQHRPAIQVRSVIVMIAKWRKRFERLLTGCVQQQHLPLPAFPGSRANIPLRSIGYHNSERVRAQTTVEGMPGALTQLLRFRDDEFLLLKAVAVVRSLKRRLYATDRACKKRKALLQPPFSGECLGTTSLYGRTVVCANGDAYVGPMRLTAYRRRRCSGSVVSICFAAPGG
jgi:hypothetical protein